MTGVEQRRLELFAVTVLSYDYSYDNNGNITEIRQNGELINKYTYDSPL